MPEPVSTIGLCYLAGYAALNVYARGGSAISSEARAAQKSASAVVESVERSCALFGEKAAAISQLRTLAHECLEQGWDGNDSSPINPVAVLAAESFLRALPDGTPLPEFAPEPDGSISLDWIQSRSRLFSLSIGSANRIAFAWLDGSDKGHGVARFDGQIVPARILAGIESIMNHGRTSLRVA